MKLPALPKPEGDVWKCGMRLFDGSLYSNWVNSSNLTILNSLPVVTLTNPDNGALVTNRTPTFNWTAQDDDQDSLGYEFNISLIEAILFQQSSIT